MSEKQASLTDSEDLIIDAMNACELAATVVAPVFRLFGWTWDGTSVPTHTELAQEYHDLLEQLVKHPGEYSITSGKLMVTRNGTMPGDILLGVNVAAVQSPESRNQQ